MLNKGSAWSRCVRSPVCVDLWKGKAGQNQHQQQHQQQTTQPASRRCAIYAKAPRLTMSLVHRFSSRCYFCPLPRSVGSPSAHRRSNTIYRGLSQCFPLPCPSLFQPETFNNVSSKVLTIGCWLCSPRRRIKSSREGGTLSLSSRGLSCS